MAHRPLWGEGDTVEIPNLTTSFAIYRDIETAEQIDYYTLEATAGDDLYAGISIPAIRGLESYLVSVALVGPGLPEVDHEALPAEHPQGLGALIFPSKTGEDFFEPFTQTRYWGRQRIEMKLPESGRYFLLIWNPAGETGKYVLDVGRDEIFSLGDILRFPVWWLRVHAFFEHTPYIISAAILLAGLVILVLRQRARKREASAIRRKTVRGAQ
jgi:hypothetical protein